MYEQFYYFWLNWLLFVFVLFFMEKSKQKTYMLFWILLVINSANYFISIQAIQVSLAYVIVCIGSIIYFAIQSAKLFKMTVTFIVIISYSSLQLWNLLSPTGFYIPMFIVNPLLIVVIVVFLIKSFHQQLTSLLLGISFGKLLYDWIVISYQLHNAIGSEPFIIQVCIIVISLIIIHTVQMIFFKCYERYKIKWT